MANENYINVYYSTYPEIVKGYDTLISQLFFGVKPGNTKEYSFAVNETTGYFSYKINPRLLKPFSTPQTEDKAKELAEKTIDNFVEKISKVRAANKNFPKDFPDLFNKDYLQFKSIAPIYNDTYRYITGWEALYGITLTAIPSSNSSMSAKKAVLERDSVILQLRGNSIASLDYNHTPAFEQKKFKLTTNDTSEIVYKKTGLNTFTPYYATPNGYVPACSESLPLLAPMPTPHFKVKPQNGYGACKSMITLSDITEPENDTPGKAKIVIAMEYRIITEGEGAVNNVATIDTEYFSKSFEEGNIPGFNYRKTFLKLKTLPSKDSVADVLSLEEIDMTNKEDKVTKKPLLWNYYNVTIEYQYSLSKDEGYTLWEGLKWLEDCPYPRGLYFLAPYIKEADEYYFSTILTVDELKKSMSAAEKAGLTEIDFKKRRRAVETEKTFKYTAKILSLIIQNLISDDLAIYENKVVVATDIKSVVPDICIDFLLIDDELNALLTSINSMFATEIPMNSINYAELPAKYYYTAYGIQLVDSVVGGLRAFYDPDKDSDKIAAGSNSSDFRYETINWAILNHEFYGTSTKGKKIYFGTLNATAILVHEAGHNAAAAFLHTKNGKGLYEYTQTGLQSNQGGLVYPTKENTVDILNDKLNRDNMTIK